MNSKRGYEPMNLDREIMFGLMHRFPDKFQQRLSGGLNGQPVQRRGVRASRPTARKTPLPSRDARTLQAVDSLLRRKGRGGLDMGHEEEFDGEV
jgi:hypothetical protein